MDINIVPKYTHGRRRCYANFSTSLYGRHQAVMMVKYTVVSSKPNRYIIIYYPNPIRVYTETLMTRKKNLIEKLTIFKKKIYFFLYIKTNEENGSISSKTKMVEILWQNEKKL